VSTNLPEEWHADEKRKRRFPIVGPFLWYFACLWAVLAVLFFCAVYLTVLLRWGGIGTWPIIAILAGSIVFASAVPAFLGWAVRGRRRRRAGGPPATQ
jgi:cytochrome bd-type quinol oxidase subunit 1